MGRVPQRCRRMSMEYIILYGRQTSGLHFHERSEDGFNVCLTLLQGAVQVYGLYKEYHGSVTSSQNNMMAELEFMYHEGIQSGNTLIWVAKPLFSSVNNFLYIMYEYFLAIGMLETACNVQLVYLTVFL